MSLDVAVFGRHLDLAPLNGRPRGLVTCPFHEDRRPSLSLDLAKGVFHCFGCGAGGGIKRFSELVGETRIHAGPQARESDLQRARREAMRHEQALAAKRAIWTPYWAACDRVRDCFTVARDVWAVATGLGPDHPQTWDLLEEAAQIECEGLVAEAALDALLAGGRLA
jgi:hypothetical protein